VTAAGERPRVLARVAALAGGVVAISLGCGGLLQEPAPPAESAPPAVIAAPVVVEAPAGPDLTGEWTYRGLTPYERPNLFSVHKATYRGLGGRRWAVTRRIELSSADRGAFLGTWTGEGTLELDERKACFRWDTVDFALQDWVRDLKLGDDLRRRYSAEAVAREPCADVVSVSADELSLKLGRNGWVEKRGAP
jgi:hypothetical protein